MKRLKLALIRSIPALLITIIMMVMSVVVFNRMIEKETDECIDFLSVATRTMGEKVKNSFDGNLTLLDHVADAVVLKVNQGRRDEVLAYLTTVQENTGTLFSRIDVLLPDNTLVLQTGEEVPYDGDLTFDELLRQGLHISPRRIDRVSGMPALYCVAPVEVDGSYAALLLGMVDCTQLPKMFPSYSYDGNARVFLMDTIDGSYLMDAWHPQLGNLYEMGSRELVKDYEHVNFQQEIMDGKEGAVAFVSGTNGQVIYMYYMPVPGYSWSIAMMVQEDQLFQNVHVLRGALQDIGFVLATLLVFYLMWNLLISIRLAGQEEKVQSIEVERLTNEAKSTFLSTVSHDIRTPLNGIVGMLDVIDRRGGVPDHIEDCLKKIRISTQYLMTLADDTLDLTEIDSGKLQLSHETFSLLDFAEELGVLVLPKAQQAGVRYQMDASAIAHPHVVGSAIHLRRVLMNLITNAIKYSQENGQVWVSIEEKDVTDRHAHYVFTVRDDGIGMSREFQQSMFSPFVQEHAGARSKHRGHGLGLTIVSRLVEMMNGTIQVQSEINKGSTFVVTLPLELGSTPQPSADLPDAAPVSDLKGARILLAEDNELNLEIAQILLADAGAQVTSAPNGRLAVDAFAASPAGSFDVILMDLMMPEMDGLEATRTIRRMDHPDAETIPIIAMTASTFAEDVQRCRKAGMNEHVSKPLNITEMIAKIARYLPPR